MQKIFLSYSSLDRQAVDQLAHELSQQGVSFWRDQDKLYAGQRWPKELGEAIASQDRLLLIWSKNAADSYYVEMEWSTAIALKKTVLPCRLDDTPLPNILTSLHSTDLREPLKAFSEIHRSLSQETNSPDLIHEAEVVEQLSHISPSAPHQVLQAAKNVFNQRGWVVFGNVYNAPVYYITTTDTRSIAAERQDELTLLKRVQHDWIEGVLNPSLQRSVHIELGKSAYREAVEPPLREVVGLGDISTRPLPTGTTTLQAFEEAERFLLILGEPGCGKTISMLDLTRSLIARSFADPISPIPVLFNLSTWRKQYKSMLNWLIDELGTKYQVGKHAGRAWLEGKRLLLLLDGLDEVKLESRHSCVEAINHFTQQCGVPGIAVCSRTQEYEELTVRLHFRAAIKLLPLTEEQVNNYLVRSGQLLSGLKGLIEGDPSLAAMAQSPLMLNIMSIAYKNVAPDRSHAREGPILETRRSNVFNTYISSMFKRKGTRQQPYNSHQVLNGLSWLASQMIKHSQSQFLIEGIQPDWLPNNKVRLVYWTGSRLALGITVSVLFGVRSLSDPLLFVFAVGAVITGLIDGTLFHKKVTNSHSRELEFHGRFLFYGLGYLPIIVIADILLNTSPEYH
jgi:hypothetical protein